MLSDLDWCNQVSADPPHEPFSYWKTRDVFQKQQSKVNRKDTYTLSAVFKWYWSQLCLFIPRGYSPSRPGGWVGQISKWGHLKMQVCLSQGKGSFRFLLFTKRVLNFFLTRFEGNNKAAMLANTFELELFCVICELTLWGPLTNQVLHHFIRVRVSSQVHASKTRSDKCRMVCFIYDVNILSAQRFQQKLISQSKEFRG